MKKSVREVEELINCANPHTRKEREDYLRFCEAVGEAMVEVFGIDTERCALLEQYRHEVERYTESFEEMDEDRLDAFLDHVESCFDASVTERECARRWEVQTN